MTPELQRRIYDVPAAESKEGVLKNFAQSLDFPSYFGHNLDALEDSLRDFAEGLAEPSTLVWNIDPEFKRSKAYASVLSILHGVESARLRIELRHLEKP
ncbi:RNAse (barnase) inhibitor barstar [Psychromicrobium silvestre]|uniref:RNAse (Barnase) inhibitor barstar n=1 Tax=Psychromicrobium silvestre TaxID=1645614 RepID=A0A7Y9LVA9_9MICC|nr:barstar family protein [Psychromicrobium silvestre]NYE96279.1 RNAse (barnase) inhibitor barstar [Psychromicrobium silvestre]